MKQVTLMLRQSHAQESKGSCTGKAVSIAAKLREMKLLSAAKKVEQRGRNADLYGFSNRTLEPDPHE